MPPRAVPVFWGVVAVLVAFGVAGLATIGPVLLVLAAVLVAVALAVPSLRRPSVPGILVGLSTAPLYIAWLNRGGPGAVCSSTPTSSTCTEQWSPWPFVAVGVLLVGAAAALVVTRRRRGSQTQSTASPATDASVPRT